MRALPLLVVAAVACAQPRPERAAIDGGSPRDASGRDVTEPIDASAPSDAGDVDANASVRLPFERAKEGWAFDDVSHPFFLTCDARVGRAVEDAIVARLDREHAAFDRERDAIGVCKSDPGKCSYDLACTPKIANERAFSVVCEGESELAGKKTERRFEIDLAVRGARVVAVTPETVAASLAAPMPEARCPRDEPLTESQLRACAKSLARAIAKHGQEASGLGGVPEICIRVADALHRGERVSLDSATRNALADAAADGAARRSGAMPMECDQALRKLAKAPR